MNQEIANRLNANFGQLQALIYQGRLADMLGFVGKAANNAGLDYQDLVTIMDEHKQQIAQGKTVTEATEILSEKLGDKEAADAFKLLYDMRVKALELLLKLKVSDVRDELLKKKIQLPQNSKLNAELSLLRSSLVITLVDLGGLGKKQAEESLRRFEDEARKLMAPDAPPRP